MILAYLKLTISCKKKVSFRSCSATRSCFSENVCLYLTKISKPAQIRGPNTKAMETNRSVSSSRPRLDDGKIHKVLKAVFECLPLSTRLNFSFVFKNLSVSILLLLLRNVVNLGTVFWVLPTPFLAIEVHANIDQFENCTFARLNTVQINLLSQLLLVPIVPK